MTIDIRLTSPDIAGVRALLAELDAYLGSLYPPHQHYIVDAEALRQSSVTFLAAWDGPHVIACGAVRVMPAEPASADKSYGEIKRMFTSPTRRGERIGLRILEALEKNLQGRGIDQALLETGVPQVAALKLYARCGYRPRRTFGLYPNDGVSIFMEKQWKTA